MPLPVIAISNASTCLTDSQVEAVLPALQKQVSDDFKAYSELDCTLTFLSREKPLTRGWWQIVITDNPDQAGALGYHEMTTTGTPLGKVFAKLDIENGYSWTATLSHEYSKCSPTPGSTGAPWAAIAGSTRSKSAMQWRTTASATRLTASLSQTSSRLPGSSPPPPIALTSSNISRHTWNSRAEATSRSSIPPTAGHKLMPGAREARASRQAVVVKEGS